MRQLNYDDLIARLERLEEKLNQSTSAGKQQGKRRA